MTNLEWSMFGDASASHQAVTIAGVTYSEQGERKCYCPDDCNCHHAWRPNYCGCRGHDNPTLDTDSESE